MHYSKLWLMAIVMVIAVGVPSTAAVINVNQSSGTSYGPVYKTIAGAITKASSGDTICITDSKTYKESVLVSKNNLTLVGAAGESPYVSGETISSEAVISVTGSGNTIKNIGVNVGGASLGVKITGSNTTISGVSFDMTVAARTGCSFAINSTNTGPTTIFNCNFLGRDDILAGGIIVNNAAITVNLTVNCCDFWGFGGVNGMIGIGGINNNSNITVQNTCFANSRLAPSGYEICGINKWGGSITITESDNTFYNINTPISPLVNSGTLNSVSSASISGNGSPVDSGVVINMDNINNLLNFLSIPLESDATLKSFNGPLPIETYLSKSMRCHFHTDFADTFDPVSGRLNGPRNIQFMKNTGTKHWENFEITWGKQYTPAAWNKIKIQADATHASCPNTVLGGLLMECITKTPIENTPIPNQLWCWMARWTRATAMRPMESKTIDGRRIIAHFFDYDLMLNSRTTNWWAIDSSMPDLNKQEALMYYIYAAKEFIDAGMNEVSFAQPHWTFGQGRCVTGVGGPSLRMVSKFAKNYGLYKAPYIDGKRFIIVEVNSQMNWLRDYSEFIDYFVCPAGTDYYGAGKDWPTLADSWNNIPPSYLGLAGKPMCLELDNYSSSTDHSSTFAHATPAARNAWLVSFTKYIKDNYGYFLMQPGWIPVTPEKTQNFTGYTAGSSDYPFGWSFLPYDEYSGCESVIAKMFDPTNPPTGSISIESGAAYTIGSHVTLSLPATDAETCVRKVSLRNDNDEWSEWMDYKPTMAWTLASDEGTRTVSARYQDYPGNISQVYSDTIVVDYDSPTGSISINSGAIYTASQEVSLSLAATDNGTGVTQMKFQNYGYAWSEWEAYSTAKTWTLPSGSGVKQVCVQFMDGTGSTSTVYTAGIALGSPVSVSEAKKKAIGSFVVLSGVDVTASFSDCAYVEDPLGACGIKVTSGAFTQNTMVDVAGTLLVSNGEKVLGASIYSITGSAQTKPRGIRADCVGGGDWNYVSSTDAGQKGTLGGQGLNNIGLLVRTWGKFGYVNPTTFTVDDGSGALECVVPTGVTLNSAWSYACVTGISSTKQTMSGLIPQIRVREQNDILGL
ncbi:MAG: hypothetical protein ABFD54_06785 [Armatimonadota bacterium]